MNLSSKPSITSLQEIMQQELKNMPKNIQRCQSHDFRYSTGSTPKKYGTSNKEKGKNNKSLHLSSARKR